MSNLKKNDVVTIVGESLNTCYGNGESGLIVEVTGGKALVRLSGVWSGADWFKLSQLSKTV